MQYFNSLFPFSLLFWISPLCLLGQTSDSTRIGQLPEVQVNDERARYVQRMREIEGVGIFAGKKSDVILLANIDANLALNNTRQVLGKVPGITLWENDGSGLQNNIAFRGLSPNRSWELNTRQNGYDISADNFGYPEAYYAPPMEAVQRLEIVRGASSLQYGPQVGGLLNYVLKTAPQDQRVAIESRQTIGAFGLFNTYNSIGGTVGKFRYFGYGQYRRGEGWRDNSGFNTSNLHLHTEYAPSEKWKVGLEWTRTRYLLQQPGGLTDAQWAENPRQSRRRRNWFSAPWNTASLQAEWKPNDRFRWKTQVFALTGARNSVGFLQNIHIPDTLIATIGAYAPRQIDRFDFKNAGLESRCLYEYKGLGQRHALATGVRLYQGSQQRLQRGKGDTGSDYTLETTNGHYPFDMHFRTRNAAVFAENVFRYGKVAFIPGIRYEWVQAHADGHIQRNSDGSPVVAPVQHRNRSLLLAGVGAEIHLWEHTEFYLNTSTAYRPVLFSDLVPGTTLDEIDPQLRDGKSRQMDLGLRGDWHDWLRFDAGVYYLHYQNRIGSLTLLRPGTTTVYSYRTNVGDSRSYGTEWYIEADVLKPFNTSNKWGNIQMFAALSWMNTRYGHFETATVKNGAVVRTNLQGNRVEYAPDYVHRFGLTYARKGFSTTLRHSSTGAVFTDAGNTAAPVVNAQAGLLPAWQVMDWSATWNFRTHYLIAMGIDNLQDARYATRRASGFPGPGLMPADGRSFYVTFGVKW